jgi:poly-D-alanine transfer protein DltD
MEDGIESNKSILIDQMDNKFLYVYIPENGTWKDYILLHDRKKALEMCKKNNGIVQVFLLNDEKIYKKIY